MGSYYREHVSYPNVTAGPYPPELAAALESVGNIANSNKHKNCSVKGCCVSLPSAYPHKMCEDCRGRHRVYAVTKRAKRKMEKALLNGSAQNGQPVAWMPPDGQQEQINKLQSSEAGSSRHCEAPAQGKNEGYNHLQEWDASLMDSRLFPQTASELTGALTLPTSQHHVDEEQYLRHRQAAPLQQTPHRLSPSLPAEAQNVHPVLAEVLNSVPGLGLTTPITSRPTVYSSATKVSLPPRFCSIKGCKTLIAGKSFFKMCEPCRNRYRSYGTTKRARWKHEKEVAITETNKLRAEEIFRRAAQGLPPLPLPEDSEWRKYLPGEDEVSTVSTPGSHGTGERGGSAAPSAAPPRMCTVSHCREVLPGDYHFLRCERHRLQNRHHSKLKRVRDKEVKAQVHDGWVAIAPRTGSFDSTEDRSAESDPEATAPVDPDDVVAHEIAMAFGQLDRPYGAEDQSGNEFASGTSDANSMVTIVQETGNLTHAMAQELTDDIPCDSTSGTSGLPPAARGFRRRRNHICSIRQCANLLSPINPLKMCDLCRSRDRAGRRLKTLREGRSIAAEFAAGKMVEVQMEMGRPEEKRPQSEQRSEGDVNERERDSAASPEQLQLSEMEQDPSAPAYGVSGHDDQNSVYIEPLTGRRFEQQLRQDSDNATSSGGTDKHKPLTAQLNADVQSKYEVAATASIFAEAKKQSRGSGREHTTEMFDEINTMKPPAFTPTSSTQFSHQGYPTFPPCPPPPNGQQPYPYCAPPMSSYGAPEVPYNCPPLSSPNKTGITITAYSAPPAYQMSLPYIAHPYPYPYPNHSHPYPSHPYPPSHSQHPATPTPSVQPYPPTYSCPSSYSLAASYPPHTSGDSQPQQSSYIYPQSAPPYPYPHYYLALPSHYPYPLEHIRQQSEPQSQPMDASPLLPAEAPPATPDRQLKPLLSLQLKDVPTNDDDKSVSTDEPAQI